MILTIKNFKYFAVSKCLLEYISEYIFQVILRFSLGQCCINMNIYKFYKNSNYLLIQFIYNTYGNCNIRIEKLYSIKI